MKVCPQLHSQCDGSLGYTEPCQKEIKERKECGVGKVHTQSRALDTLRCPEQEDIGGKSDLCFDILVLSPEWLHLFDPTTMRRCVPTSPGCLVFPLIK